MKTVMVVAGTRPEIIKMGRHEPKVEARIASRERMSHFLLSEGERNAEERRNRRKRSGKASA
jgi:UDP-N-acetylglucosamine 2-epimerase